MHLKCTHLEQAQNRTDLLFQMTSPAHTKQGRIRKGFGKTLLHISSGRMGRQWRGRGKRAKEEETDDRF